MKYLTIILGLTALLFWQAAGAEVYRWTDKDGHVHYSDNPPVDAGAKPRKLYDSHIDVDKLPYETRQAATKFPVTLYVQEGCKEPCTDGRAWLAQRKIPFSEKSLKTAEDIQALKALTGKDTPPLPVLTVGSTVVEKFDPAAWASALDYAGYPK